MKTLKQVVGIDVSKDTFHACLGTINEQQQIKLLKQTSFVNANKGFLLLKQWVRNHGNVDLPCIYVMEATGVYYENLAYYLTDKKLQVVVMLPNKTKHFAKSLDIKTKTDKVDAAIICRIGLERSLPLWNLPTPKLKTMKALCREHQVLKGNTVKLKVRLHALAHSHQPEAATLDRLKQQMCLIQQQIKEVQAEINTLIKEDEYLQKQFNNIEQVKGIGTMTIATIVAETNGFTTIENIKQLASYAGLDVVMNQSGLHNGRTRISKKGNSHIRSALYPPAMSALQSNKHLQQFYHRIMEKKTCGKIGVTAVARKMLILIYTLWTKQVPYNPMLNVT